METVSKGVQALSPKTMKHEIKDTSYIHNQAFAAQDRSALSPFDLSNDKAGPRIRRNVMSVCFIKKNWNTEMWKIMISLYTFILSFISVSVYESHS